MPKPTLLRTALCFLMTWLALSTPSLLLAADVYKTVDKDGNIIFTDTPGEESDPEAVELQEPNTVPATPVQKQYPSNNQGRTNNYKISIASPTEGQRFPNRLAGLTVSVKVKPRLAPGFKVRLILNGEKHSVGGEQFVVDQLPQGQSTLQVQLLDKNKRVVDTSSAVTVFAAQPGG